MQLQTMCATASSLDATLGRGVLRFCSSGDYRLFTCSIGGRSDQGADIDMTASLAASFGARVEF